MSIVSLLVCDLRTCCLMKVELLTEIELVLVSLFRSLFSQQAYKLLLIHEIYST